MQVQFATMLAVVLLVVLLTTSSIGQGGTINPSVQCKGNDHG